MIDSKKAFSGYSVKDLAKAQVFYEKVLGISAKRTDMGLELHVGGGNPVFLYEKPDHEPATFTVLNFIVEDIDETVTALRNNGVSFEQYDFGNGAKTDEYGIMRGLQAHQGPDIAWFTDPSGNVLSVLQNK